MLMSWIFTGILLISTVFAVLTGRGSALAAAVPQGAQAGITLAISLAGSLCLWSGVGRLMEAVGATKALSQWLKPLLTRLFPSTKNDSVLGGYLSGNICANILGLGNAATPMGVNAAKRLANSEVAGDELCRLIVLNAASLQLIPTNLAAIRVGLGCATPFDILPAVWVTSLCAAAVGLGAAYITGKLWKDG